MSSGMLATMPTIPPISLGPPPWGLDYSTACGRIQRDMLLRRWIRSLLGSSWGSFHLEANVPAHRRRRFVLHHLLCHDLKTLQPVMGLGFVETELDSVPTLAQQTPDVP